MPSKKLQWYPHFGRSQYAGAIMGYVVAVLRRRGPGPMKISPEHLAGLFNTTRHTIGMSMKRLLDQGFFVRLGRGEYMLSPRGERFICESESIGFSTKDLDRGLTPKQAALKAAAARATSQRQAARWLGVNHRTVGRGVNRTDPVVNTTPHPKLTERPSVVNTTPQNVNRTPHKPYSLNKPEKGSLTRPPAADEQPLLRNLDKACDLIVNLLGKFLSPNEITSMRKAWEHSTGMGYTPEQVLAGVEWLFKNRKFKRVSYIAKSLSADEFHEHPAGKAKAETIQRLEAQDVARQRELQGPPEDEDARMMIESMGKAMKTKAPDPGESEHAKRVRAQAEFIRTEERRNEFTGRTEAGLEALRRINADSRKGDEARQQGSHERTGGQKETGRGEGNS